MKFHRKNEESTMPDLGATVPGNHVSPLYASLWHCEACNSFVSIHSARPVEQAMCPVCRNAPLEFCGRFESVLGLHFADA